MIDFSKYRTVDISPRLVGRVKKFDGTVIEGERDVMGLPWLLQDRMSPPDMDGSAARLVGGWDDDPLFPGWKMNAHFGLHTEGGVGHIDHWEGIPDTMKGLWDYPLDSFMGPAAVCDLTPVEPGPEHEGKADIADYHNKDKDKPPHRGQAIMPEHLSNVQEGDIVLMWSPYKGPDHPWIPKETAEWLLSMKIKMLGIQMPGVKWDTAPKAPPPNNSPTHRNLLGNNIAIAYPFANLEEVKKDRVTYIGLPLNVVHMDASWVRAIVLEEL